MAENYRLIGLTGPTGAGKSSVSQIFKEHGFAVTDADTIAHRALCNADCIHKLAEAFGTDILDTNGKVNRKALAKAAFANKASTQKLNRITHPVIIKLSLEEFSRLADQGYKNIIFDAPTLIEAGMDTMCDFIISVIAPANTREMRIIQRDHLTPEQAKARISAQQDDRFYTKRSRFVITNDCDKDSLISRTEDIIKEIL